MVSILGHQKHGNERNEDSFYMAFEKNQNENSEKNRQVCCQGKSKYPNVL